MTPAAAIARVLEAHEASKKPLAIVLAGHNGSGKSTFWYKRLAEKLQIPLVNADRMMLSILPESDGQKPLPRWATQLRDQDSSWMQVAQKGVEAFVAQAMAHQVPFAMETVFSYLEEQNGQLVSKVDNIKKMQAEGYFTLLIFVGLANVDLSVARVATRVAAGGHAVEESKLRKRFPKTQRAIGLALEVADAALLVDNSRSQKLAFSVCRVEVNQTQLFDIRSGAKAPAAVNAWLELVVPS